MRWWDGEAWSSALSQSGVEVGPAAKVVERPPSIDRRATKIAVGAYFGAALLAIAAFVGAAALTDEPAVLLIVAQTALYGTLIYACRTAIARYGSGSWSHDLGFRVQPADIGLGIVTFFAASVVANVIANLVTSDSDLQGSNTRTLLEADSGWPYYVAVVLVVVVAAPVVEELFFRGLLLRALAARYPPLAANLMQGTLFALAHVDPSLGWRNADTLIRVGVLGLAFGFVAQEQGRLGPGMVAHAITNSIAVVVNLALLR